MICSTVQISLCCSKSTEVHDIMDMENSLTPFIWRPALRQAFSRKKISFENHSRDYVSMDTFRLIQKRCLELAPVYLGTSVSNDLNNIRQKVPFFKKLQGLEFDEATTRVFVDAVITPILQQNQMQVRLQVKIDKIQDNSTDPTYFTADYVIFNQSDDVIGIVEAKAGGCLATESVIDCMETLRHLQAKATHRLFGVITDGAHYVFVVLTTDGVFVLEPLGDAAGVDCREVDTWWDLQTVTAIFNSLLQSEKGSVFCTAFLQATVSSPWLNFFHKNNFI